MTPEEFIKFVRKECKYYGVKCSLRKSSYIKYNSATCSGCFDDENLTLVCAMNREDFLSILAHEYCHLTQWVEKADVWIKAAELKSYEAWGKHMAGENIPMDVHFDAMRDLELDNERRTVALIKKLHLPIECSLYTKKANVYVMLYNWLKLGGKWPHPQPSIYNNERLLSAVPDKFSMNYNKLPKKLEKIFREEVG